MQWYFYACIYIMFAEGIYSTTHMGTSFTTKLMRCVWCHFVLVLTLTCAKTNTSIIIIHITPYTIFNGCIIHTIVCQLWDYNIESKCSFMYVLSVIIIYMQYYQFSCKFIYFLSFCLAKPTTFLRWYLVSQTYELYFILYTFFIVCT